MLKMFISFGAFHTCNVQMLYLLLLCLDWNSSSPRLLFKLLSLVPPRAFSAESSLRPDSVSSFSFVTSAKSTFVSPDPSSLSISSAESYFRTASLSSVAFATAVKSTSFVSPNQ